MHTLPKHHHSFLICGVMWDFMTAVSGGKLQSNNKQADRQCRKKCFTNSERLRITQPSPQPSLKTKNSHQTSSKTHNCRGQKSTPEPCHISTLPDNWKPSSDRKVKQSMTSSLLRSRRRHSRPNIEQQQSVVSEEQAAWFLALPDKVKRQHFSKEEQTLLADRCESVLDKLSPKVHQESAQEFCRRRLYSHPEEERKVKHRRRSSAPVSTRTFDEGLLASIAAADAPEVVGDGESDKMAILNLYTRRHSVSTTHESRPEPPVVTKAQIRSFRKSFALRPLQLPAPVLAPLPSPGFFKDNKDHSRPAKVKRRPTKLSLISPELSPEAKHYKDPEMRRTLRAMSSPELFDEALEYGFPPPPSQVLPKGARNKPKLSANTPENDRSSSLTSSSTAETKDLPYGTVPTTPDGSTYFRESSPDGTTSQAESKPATPPHLHRRANTAGDLPYHHRSSSSVNREMTLRMTLTRPMLRATETVGYSAERKPSLQTPLLDQHDPLALESISICDDPTGAQGAFAINPETSQNLKGIKKALKHWVRK
jgi:hypothetical protein